MAHRRGRFVRPAPKTKIWIGAGVGDTTIVASTVQLISSLSAAALLLRPFTVLRSRILLFYGSDQVGVSERPIGSFGQLVVTRAASTLGVTALPDPSAISGDPDQDWFIWQANIVDFRFVSGVGFESAAGIQYVIDSKAMRKVGPNDDIVAVHSQENAVGAVLSTNGRMLIQLH